MLVLSRKKNERIICTTPDGDEITITVVEMRHGKVRIGVHADRKITIHREEVADAISREIEMMRPVPHI